MSIKYRLEKLAEMRELGTGDMHHAAYQAMRRGNTGFGQIIADDETMGARLRGQAVGALQGLGVGALGGGLIGAGLGRTRSGAIVGAGLGGLAGQIRGAVEAERELLARRGIHPTKMHSYLGFGGGEIDPEIAAQHGVKVAYYSEIADLAQSGALGDDVQAAFEGMTSAINSHIEEEVPEKIASVEETDYNIYDENAARIARLNNLLRK